MLLTELGKKSPTSIGGEDVTDTYFEERRNQGSIEALF